ncbi:MAG: glycosyltransferase family 2 protein [Ruminiclostridium sp.]
MAKNDISIIIPCLNGEKRIAACIGEAQLTLQRYGISGRIIVADNKSSDKSVQRAVEKGAAVVETPQHGWGNIVRAAMLSSEEKYVIVCDMYCDFVSIPDFYNALLEGSKVVVGSRFMDGRKPELPLSCKIYSRAAAKLLSARYHCDLSDLGSGMYGFDRDEIMGYKLKSGGRTMLTEILCKHLKNNGTVTQIPVVARRGTSCKTGFSRKGDCAKNIATALFS